MSDMTDTIDAMTEGGGDLMPPPPNAGAWGSKAAKREREVKQGNFMQKNFQTCTIKHNFNS